MNELIRSGRLDGRAEALNSLANLYLSVECDALLATFSSNWGRLLLKVGEGGLLLC
jgi:hypothetical protein